MLTRRASAALTVLALVVLVGVVLAPQLSTLSLGLDAGVLASVFGRVQSAGVRALVASVLVSLGTVAGSAVVGTSLAVVLARVRLPFGRVLAAAAALPLALPPLVGVLAFLFLYGESGMLPRGIQALTGSAEVPFSFEGIWAVGAVHVYVFYVYVYLFVGAALRGIDGSMLDASADLGASAATTFRRVVLPLLRPALVGSGLLVFMLSMASFTAPLLFAEGTPFLTTQIYTFKTNGALDRAAAVSVVLTLVCLAVLALAERRPQATGAGAAKGIGRAARPVRNPAMRVLAGVGVVGALVVVALPVATVVLLSFVVDGTWTTQALPDTFSLANYAALASDPNVLAPVASSLWMAALATAANVVFGVAVAFVVAKGRVPGRGLVRALAVLPFAIPGTSIALGLVVAFNAPHVWTGGGVLVGTVWILPVAYFVRHIPLVVRSTQAALESVDDRLAEASQDLGAGAWTTLRRVVLPLVAPAIAAGALLTFVTAIGEFVASVMLYVYDNRPISVETFAQIRQGAFGQAAAYSVLLMVLVAASVALSRLAGAETRA